MRVLFTLASVPSHVRPLLPVARVLCRAGHDVLVVTSPKLAQVLARENIPAAAVLPDEASRTPGPGEPEYESDTLMSELIFRMLRASGTLRAAHQVVDLAREFRPDLVLRDDSEFGGYLAAQHLGVPVVVLPGAVVHAMDPSILAGPVNAYRAAMGLPELADPVEVYQGGRIDYLPEELSFAAHPLPTALRFREPVMTDWQAATEGRSLPREVAAEPGDRPLVVAAFGTAWRTWEQAKKHDSDIPIMNDFATSLRATLAALSEMDCVALVSTGGLDVGRLPRAGHVHVRPHLPQTLVLEAAQLFITHGGYNSIRESLRAGVPMVVHPFTLDQPFNAGRVAELGLGQAAVDSDPAELHRICTAVLRDPGVLATVRQAQRAVLALPDLDCAPAALAGLPRSAGHRADSLN